MQRKSNHLSIPSRRAQGFTLVEMLVVIAITVILLGLLFYPLTKAFQLTQRAQVLAAAQDSARKVMEQITRELGSAVYVFDNQSHAFTGGATTTANDDRYTNFLNLEITNNNGGYVLAHAYNAKVDLVPARRSGSGTLIDPTTNDTITLDNNGGGPATPKDAPSIFPLAGGPIVRYFPGLKRPVEYSGGQPSAGHYANGNEGGTTPAGSDDNTYVEWRAQVIPYKTDGSGQRIVNTTYFAASETDPTKAELDDPDFFRYVSDNDINWLSSTHATYGASSATAAHNLRVENWLKIAKPVITATEMDLLLLPHKRDGSLLYDSGDPNASPAVVDEFPTIANSSVTRDPITGTDSPTINTSITFRPANVSNDAAPATTNGNAAAGVPTDALNGDGLPYVPTVYTASSRSWAFPYSLTLYPLSLVSGSATPTFDANQPFYEVRQDTSSGHLLEYRRPDAATMGVAVYDITTKSPISGNNYVPLSVRPDAGIISFSVPATPPLASNQRTPGSAPGNPAVPPSGWPYADNPQNQFWYFGPFDINNSLYDGQGGNPNYGVGNLGRGVIDLTRLTNRTGTLATPLPFIDATAPTGTQVANARVVPGSVRVYGPDATPGANLGRSVPYTAVGQGDPVGFNQYRIDYAQSSVSFYADESGSNKLPETQADGTTPADPIQISFDYQANLSPQDNTNPISSRNPANPMLVKVDYQTRDILEISIGVRIYDNTNNGAQIVTVSNQVKINNSNR